MAISIFQSGVFLRSTLRSCGGLVLLSFLGGVLLLAAGVGEASVGGDLLLIGDLFFFNVWGELDRAEPEVLEPTRRPSLSLSADGDAHL